MMEPSKEEMLEDEIVLKQAALDGVCHQRDELAQRADRLQDDRDAWQKQAEIQEESLRTAHKVVENLNQQLSDQRTTIDALVEALELLLSTIGRHEVEPSFITTHNAEACPICVATATLAKAKECQTKSL